MITRKDNFLNKVSELLLKKQSEKETIDELIKLHLFETDFEAYILRLIDLNTNKFTIFTYQFKDDSTEKTFFSDNIGCKKTGFNSNFSKKEIFFIKDLSCEKGFPFEDISNKTSLKNALCMPLYMENDFIGTIELYSSNNKISKKDTINFSQSFFLFLSVFIENVFLTKKLSQKDKELSELAFSLQQFVYSASHDLQEPIRKITSFGGLLKSRSQGALDQSSQEFLEIMLDGAERMKRLLGDLLIFSRVSSKEMKIETLWVGELLNEVLIDLENEKKEVSTEVCIKNTRFPINGDKNQLKILFNCLISNSLKFHKEGIPLKIEIDSKEIEDYLEITIKDNGIGFDMKFIDKVFSPFEKLHPKHEYKGSGLGLAICKKIVERHKGEINAVSEEGKGALFSVRLPRTGKDNEKL